MSARLSPALDDIRLELEGVSERARQLIGGMREASIGQRPDPSSWSVAECLAHLNRSTDAYLPPIRQALAEGRRANVRSTGESFRLELIARALAWWLEPPYRIKSRTPAAFVPGAVNAAKVLPEFLDREDQLIALLAEADGLALDRLRIPSPFAPQMRYSVYAAFRLIAVHQRRHLWQAEHVLQQLTEMV